MTFDIRECSYFEAAKKKFLSGVIKTDTCWFWQKAKTGNGYGLIQFDNQQYSTHRLSYMFFNGPIPQDKLIRHTCDNKSCVNPEHLILGTSADNLEDAARRNYKIGQQKLNSEAVKVIKWYLKYQPKRGLATKLAKLHKVSLRTIWYIKTGRTWRWIKV